MNFVDGAEAAKHGAETLGIRPEHLSLSTENGAWKGTVGIAEHLGSDTFLHVRADGIGQITARANGEIGLKHGDTVYLTPQPDKIHRFGRRRTGAVTGRLDGQIGADHRRGARHRRGLRQEPTPPRARRWRSPISIWTGPKTTAAEIGGVAYAVELDVTDQASIEEAVQTVEARSGGIDILVNNAAVFDLAPIVEITRASYDRLFAINVAGTLFTLQAVARSMIARGKGGKIINMASQAGRRGEALVAVYCATKAAVISLTQSAGLDLIKHGINVNAIAPGVVDGEHWEGVDALFAKYENRPLGEKKRLVGEAVPYGRMGARRGSDRHGDVPRQRRKRLHRRPDLQCRRRQLDELKGLRTMYLEKLKLDGRVAVVTGGGQGIGAACAQALGEAGAKVVVAEMLPDRVQTCVDELKTARHRRPWR